ncbi:energy-converting hydrogenase subunit EhaL family protein [Methanocaldococcus sp.]
MSLLFLDLAIISFIIGNFLGLEYSYRKYSLPYKEKNIDYLALILSIIGGILVNFNLIIGSLLLGFPLGMRSGYGRIEFLAGLLLALFIWVIL